MRAFFCIEMKMRPAPTFGPSAYGSTRQDRVIRWSRRLPVCTPAVTVGKPGEGLMRFPRENSVPRISTRQMNSDCLRNLWNIPGQSVFEDLLDSAENSG